MPRKPGRPKIRDVKYKSVNVHPDVHHRIRVLSVKLGAPMYDILEQGIRMLEAKVR